MRIQWVTQRYASGIVNAWHSYLPPVRGAVMQLGAFLPDGREGESGTCRSCGATVVWVRNPKTGKRPPYNPDGVSHFATCPQAPSWKGKART